MRDEWAREAARAIARVEDAGWGEGVVCGTTHVGREVARDIEDDLGSRPGGRSGIGDRESTGAAKSHRDRVGPVIVEWEVERRARRVVHRDGADEKEAEAGLLSDGQVAGHSSGGRGNAAM